MKNIDPSVVSTVVSLIYALSFIFSLIVTYLVFRFIIRPALGLDRIENLLREINSKNKKRKKE